MTMVVKGVTGMSHVYGLINSATEMEDRTHITLMVSCRKPDGSDIPFIKDL